MNRSLLAAACAMSVAALALVARAEDNARYHDGIAAEVNGEPVTYHEIEVFARLSAQYRKLIQAGAPALDVARRRFLKEQLKTIIEERVMLQEAAKQSIKLSKEDEHRLDRELERAALQHGGVEALKNELEKIGVPYDYFVERKRANMLIGKLLMRNVSREIFIPPEQIRRYYREHPEKFERRGRIVLRQIWIYNDPSKNGPAIRIPKGVEALSRDAWDPMALARKLRALALAPGGDFAALAREWHMGADAQTGGLYVGETVDLIDPIPAVALRLKPGEVSEPVRSPLGVHLIQMVERRPRGTLPLYEVQREIESRLKSEAWQERLAAWIKQLTDPTHAIVREYFATD